MLSERRIEVLAADGGGGRFVGSGATRAEERELAREVVELRAIVALAAQADAEYDWGPDAREGWTDVQQALHDALASRTEGGGR